MSFFCLLALASAISTSQQKIFPKLAGPYLGQKPPGSKARLFAPDILDYEVHESPIFLSGGAGMIVCTMDEGIKFYKPTADAWVLAGDLPFPVPERLNSINLSPTGKRVYFLVREGDRGEKFWTSEKAGDRWTKPHYLGDDVNSCRTHWQFSVAANESLYFQSEGRIMVSRMGNGRHGRPIPLKLVDGRDLVGDSPHVAPDESYLIASSGRDPSACDLFISYRNQNGSWSQAKYLGTEINAPRAYDLCPKVTGDGKYMFFLSNRSGYYRIYWVNAGFVEGLRPKD